MTRIFISIIETTPDATIGAIRRIADDRVGIEVRVDSFDPDARRAFDLAALRAASKRPMIYTRRSGDGRPGATSAELLTALDAGFDFIDVELDNEGALDQLPLGSVILSYHDFEAVPDLAVVIERMERTGAANLKIAVTPHTFAEDLSILERLSAYDGPARLTLFGMGSCGLYSRTLAPFFGSRFSFVALDEARRAAPGQLTLERGMEIWDALADEPTAPEALFAVVGNPVSHSQSPRIHNARFRAEGVPAAYGMIEVGSIAPVLDAMAAGSPLAPRGLSVTAPFKTDLVDEARARGLSLTERAERAGSANTVVQTAGGFAVDNTDVLGFAAALTDVPVSSRIAVVGAGGTARAAALAASGIDANITIFNRTLSKATALAEELGAESRALDDAGEETFDVVIDTLPGAVSREVTLPRIAPGGLLISAGYDVGNRASASDGNEFRTFGPIELLEAQAEEQSRCFIAAAGERR